MPKILKKLSGGDLRSIGRADEVAQDIIKKPELFEEVFEGLKQNDPRIRMRTADAIQKVSEKHPEYLEPYKSRLINEISKIEQPEVQWHLAQMFSCLRLTAAERLTVFTILENYIKNTDSAIVKVNSLQILADLANQESQLKNRAIAIIEAEIKKGSPAVFSRGKKLLSLLK